MSVPRTQVIALVISSIASIVLTIGGLTALSGTRGAEASPKAPEASILSGSTVAVPVLPGAIASAEPPLNVIAIPEERQVLALGPIDADAIAAGFRRGGYRFTVRTVNFASFAAASPIETGVVPDAEHFILEWPGSTFISRYERDGESRTAWLGRSIVALVPGDGWERTPDEMLPIDFYLAAIDPWAGSLPGGSADGTYAAKTAVLTSEAQALGVTATDWTLSVTVDGRGRLTAAWFAGLVRERPFQLVIDVTYDDTTGSAMATAAPGTETPGSETPGSETPHATR